MKRGFTQYFPAAEGMQKVERRVLSVEEEQLDIQETAEIQQDVSQDLVEADRMIEVSDVLENAADVAGTVETSTPAEAALLEVVGDAAVAGTDVPPAEVVPSMEGFVGKKLAVEGIRETANAIWKSIQSILKKIWENIKKFWNKFFGTIPSLRRRIVALKERAETVTGRKKEHQKVEITSGVSSLCVDFKAVSNAADLKKNLDVQAKNINTFLGVNLETTSKIGESIADIIADTDASNAHDQASKLAKILAPMVKRGAELVSKQAVSMKGWEGYNVYVGDQLFGSVRPVCKVPKDSTAGDANSILGELDRYRRAGVVLAHSRENLGSASVPASIDFATMDYAQMIDVLGVCESMLDKIEDYETSKYQKDVEKARKRLDDTCSKASGSYDRAKSSASASEKGEAGKMTEYAQLPYFKAMVNFNLSYTRWVQDPAMKLTSMTVATIRAVCSVVEKSIAAYE